MAAITDPFHDDKVINISATEKTPYFYMLIDCKNYYLCLRSNRRNYALDFVREIRKEDIPPEEAVLLLEEGKKFFEHAEKEIQKYLIKYGIE